MRAGSLSSVAWIVPLIAVKTIAAASAKSRSASSARWRAKTFGSHSAVDMRCGWCSRIQRSRS